MSGSPSRRHGAARVVQRRWEDVSEWPFQFVVLPVLVAFAFCLVLFLGSKHGTRLAAFRTWLPTSVPCRSAHCIQTITVDSEGGLVAGIASVGPAGGAAGGGGALSGIAGLLRLDTEVKAADAAAADDTSVLPLPADDHRKYDFDYWLAEGEKLAGQQGKDCDGGYGSEYINKWRKGRMAWCTEASNPAAAGSAASGAAAGGTTTTRGGSRRHLQDSNSGSSSTTTTTNNNNNNNNKTAPAANPGGGGGGGSSSSTSKPAPSAGTAAAPSGSSAKGGSGSAFANSSHPAVGAVTSSIALYPFHDKDAYLIFAAATNTVLDSRSFLGSLPRGAPEARPGSYLAGCRLGAAKAPSAPALGNEFVGLESVRRWTRSALKAEEYGKVSQACAAKPSNASGGRPANSGAHVAHPVLLISRFDSTNSFRTVEEVVSTFTALAVLKDPRVAKEGLQVVIADGKPDGFFLDLWAVLSRPYPLRLLSQKPWPPNTCLSHAVHNMFGGSSILTSMGVARRTTCRSSVVIAASLWLRHSLGAAIQPPVRSAFGSQRMNKGVVRKTAVWISRRNFEGLAQANLTPWQDQRRFENEGEVVLELQREVWRWNDEACIRSGLTKSFSTGHRRQRQLRRLMAQLQMDATAAAAGAAGIAHWAEPGPHLRGGAEDSAGALGDDVAAHAAEYGGGGGWPWLRRRRRLQGGSGGSRCRASSIFFDLRVVELNDIPFYPDQVQVLGQAAVLAGAHGTGLANMIWMAPGKGGVLELHHNSAGNDHYHNMAHLLGHKYVNVDSDGDRVNLAAAAEGLRKLLDMLGSGG